jgi:hypothetical protein
MRLLNEWVAKTTILSLANCNVQLSNADDIFCQLKFARCIHSFVIGFQQYTVRYATMFGDLDAVENNAKGVANTTCIR